jgi:alkylhydroperoxidase family enzyme
MADQFQSQIDRLTHAVLTSAGATALELRSKIVAWATQLDTTPDAPSDLPDAVKTYVKKVALHAYKVTDDDVQHMKSAGYSEDAIFEITLAAALAAGLKRFNTGLALLRRTPHAS